MRRKRLEGKEHVTHMISCTRGLTRKEKRHCSDWQDRYTWTGRTTDQNDEGLSLKGNDRRGERTEDMEGIL